LQFHPEVDLTTNGKQMLRNFLYNICGLSGNFTMHSRELECIEYIRSVVGNNKVLVRNSSNFKSIYILILNFYELDVSQRWSRFNGLRGITA
jgi:hypothetical protein